MNASAPASAHAWCTFRLGTGDYGVALARVQEVLRPQPVTRLPLAPPAIAGLINLRGRIVPVVDPRVALAGDDAPPAARGAGPGGFVIVSGADGPVALLVDAIGDVRRADDTPPSLAPGSAGPGADASSLIARTLALPGQLLVEFDLDRVLARAFASPGSPSRRRPRPDGTRS